MGLVFDPDKNEIFSACKGLGLRVNRQTAVRSRQPASLTKCLASVDFKRLKPKVRNHLVEKMPFKSQRNIGTCALEWAWLAAGRTQLLLHGGEKMWDYAAGSLLLTEAGGMSCSFDLKPVFNRQLGPRSVIAASTPSLHRQWQQCILEL